MERTAQNPKGSTEGLWKDHTRRETVTEMGRVVDSKDKVCHWRTLLRRRFWSAPACFAVRVGLFNYKQQKYR